MKPKSIHRIPKRYHDGQKDGLTPLAPIDLSAIADFDELLRAMSRTAFGGRALGEAADVLEAMAGDPGCAVVGTFSGAMTVAKMGLVICDMIEAGWLKAIVATGALMAHGLTEATGLAHYKYNPDKSDEELYDQGYNRIYDTLEMEKNLDDVEDFIQLVMDDIQDRYEVFSSEIICREIGRKLSEQGQHRGILRSAFEHGVPVYIPAFTDSELGLDFLIWQYQRGAADAPVGLAERLGVLRKRFDPFLDLASYTQFIIKAERTGIFTIGGGVPRNWAQQVGPCLEIFSTRLGVQFPQRRFQYGIRICPEPVHWGGLSGCTYREGISWGKFVPPAEGGRFAEVIEDATVAWPILVKAVMQRLAKKKSAKGQKKGNHHQDTKTPRGASRKSGAK